MASVENLNDLKMTQLETLLKGCLSERPDIAGRILSSEELSEYVQWMIANYGQSHRYATRDMLPYFTPGNDMTRQALLRLPVRLQKSPTCSFPRLKLTATFFAFPRCPHNAGDTFPLASWTSQLSQAISCLSFRMQQYMISEY